MTIIFNCESCGKEIKAPDGTEGKKGKCHFCGVNIKIPSPPVELDEEGLIPLAPIDEEEERHYKETLDKIVKQEHDVIAESGGELRPTMPDPENFTSEELHHFVVNYCLNMSNSKLDIAALEVAKLKKYGPEGLQAVEDFIDGSAFELALDVIPANLLKGFLAKLKAKLG